MTQEPRRYFTRQEAERLIPRLQAVMQRVMAGHAETTRLRGALEEAQRRAILAGGVRLDHEFWRSRRAALARSMTQLRASVGEIVELGAVPKDLGIGLVDFPTRLGGREVHLCWRFGEERIGFWHGLHEGYAHRKPLPSGPEEG
jgi:hypothetical protein